MHADKCSPNFDHQVMKDLLGAHLSLPVEQHISKLEARLSTIILEQKELFQEPDVLTGLKYYPSTDLNSPGRNPNVQNTAPRWIGGRFFQTTTGINESQ